MEEADEAAPPPVVLLQRPKYDNVLGCAMNCQLRGRPIRLCVLDLTANVQRALQSDTADGAISLPHLVHFPLLYFEAHLPTQLFEVRWEHDRAAWLERVDGTQSVADLAAGLLELEAALDDTAFAERWSRTPFQHDANASSSSTPGDKMPRLTKTDTATLSSAPSSRKRWRSTTAPDRSDVGTAEERAARKRRPEQQECERLDAQSKARRHRLLARKQRLAKVADAVEDSDDVDVNDAEGVDEKRANADGELINEGAAEPHEPHVADCADELAHNDDLAYNDDFTYNSEVCDLLEDAFMKSGGCPAAPDEDVKCSSCASGDNEDNLILCDGYGVAHHTHPPLLAEDVAELKRQEKLSWKEQAAYDQQRRRAEQAAHRELEAFMDSLNKQVVSTVKAHVKAKERELIEAHNDRQALRDERERLKTEAEVTACLERVLAKLIKASQPKQAQLRRRDDVPLYYLFCKPYTPTWLYIPCDVCQEWLHCVGLSPNAVAAIDQYVCESASGRQSTWTASSAGAASSGIAMQHRKRCTSELHVYPRVRLRLRYPDDYDNDAGITLRLSGATGTGRCTDTGSPTPPPPSLPPSPPGSPVDGAAAAPLAPPPLLLSEPTVVQTAASDSDPVEHIPTNAHMSTSSGVEASSSDSKPSMDVGSAVECALDEAGMRGSWYEGTIVSKETETAVVAISALHDPINKDGSLREQVPFSALRPVAPSSDSGFASALLPGMLAELWWQHGWWQVVVKHKPLDVTAVGAAGSCSGDISALDNEWSLESVQYGNCHRLQEPVLRPCRHWNPSEQTWSIIERVPAASRPVELPPPSTAKPPPQEKERKAAKRKSELSPGIKELQREEAEREMRNLLQLYAPGKHVEVRGLEEGFLGSWYQCRVLEAREARSTIRLRLCYLAFQEEDGSFWEDWFDLQHVRPMPPQHDPNFIDKLKKGQPLEINIEEGWWEVEFSGRDGPNYVVSAKRYKVQHTVSLERLRPAWNWSQHERVWSELKTKPPQVVKESASKATAKASGSKKRA